MSLIIHTLLLIFFCSNHLFADPLPSWNEGPAKSAIITFIEKTTQKESENFVPLEDRIATFDEDGTLWVEQPFYTEFFFVIEAIKLQAPQHPEWKYEEPFQSILAGNVKVLHNLSKKQIAQLIAITHAGMSIDAFHYQVHHWLDRAIHPRFKKPFIELIYQPMLEVMQLLKKHDFKIYIVSGGGQEFIRSFAQKVYGISPEYVIGTPTKVKYAYQNDHPILIKLPDILFIDDQQGKVEGMNLMIGKRPLIAFGNSTGDQQMLEWTQSNSRKNLELLIHHDDAEREYAYDSSSTIGTFSVALMDEAKKRDWIIVSMKNDWNVIFPWQKRFSRFSPPLLNLRNK